VRCKRDRRFASSFISSMPAERGVVRWRARTRARAQFRSAR
jgi:hypothetical protein